MGHRDWEGHHILEEPLGAHLGHDRRLQHRLACHGKRRPDRTGLGHGQGVLHTCLPGASGHCVGVQVPPRPSPSPAVQRRKRLRSPSLGPGQQCVLCRVQGALQRCDLPVHLPLWLAAAVGGARQDGDGLEPEKQQEGDGSPGVRNHRGACSFTEGRRLSWRRSRKLPRVGRPAEAEGHLLCHCRRKGGSQDMELYNRELCAQHSGWAAVGGRRPRGRVRGRLPDAHRAPAAAPDPGLRPDGNDG
mmetsp:Transcript_964/g.2961  ORF Transcript_964/g.2961 Transcript_964/m.2961 type:complete len:245 (+) Transcript_964:430-1164(+)